MTEIHVKGLSDLQKFLDQLAPKMERNVIRGALRAGAKVIQKEAKANVPVLLGVLRDSIRLSVRARGGAVTASVKAGGKTKNGGDAYYANMVEFGTAAHFISVQESEKPINKRLTRKRGKIVRASMTTVNRNVLKIGANFVGPTVHHPGAQPHPFMRPAFDSQAQNAVVAVGEYIKRRLGTKHGLDTSDIEISIEDEQ